MTKKKRKALIEKALEDFENGADKTNYGLCFYFDKVHSINIYSEFDFDEILPELYNQKPSGYNLMWFDEDLFGERISTKPRIECLKNALKLF